MPSASESPAPHRIAGPAAHSRTDSRNGRLHDAPPCGPWNSRNPGPRRHWSRGGLCAIRGRTRQPIGLGLSAPLWVKDRGRSAEWPPNRTSSVSRNHLQMSSSCRPGRWSGSSLLRNNLERAHFAGIVPVALSGSRNRTLPKRQRRHRARRAGRAPVARRRDGLLGRGHGPIVRRGATPHRSALGS
jgi:hypothetical protein